MGAATDFELEALKAELRRELDALRARRHVNGEALSWFLSNDSLSVVAGPIAHIYLEGSGALFVRGKRFASSMWSRFGLYHIKITSDLPANTDSVVFDYDWDTTENQSPLDVAGLAAEFIESEPQPAFIEIAAQPPPELALPWLGIE